RSNAILLENYLRNLIFGMSSKDEMVPRYKFYDVLIHKLQEQKIQIGIDISSTLNELLKSLNKDKKFVNKSKVEFENSVTQFLIVCAMTWIFNFFIEYMLNTKIGTDELSIIVIIQITG